MRKLVIIVSLMSAMVAESKGQTTIVSSISHGGLDRDYRLYIPDSYTGSVAVPLLINLHGYTSNALQQEFYGDFRAVADTANFLIVHPEGTLDNTSSQFWNAFGAPGVDDVGFLSALIDSISAAYNVDPDCIYSTGMSNGGFMSYKLACELGHRIAAIASVTGTMIQSELNNCVPAHPTPVMQIHGTVDPTVPYLGNGQGMVAVETLVEHWAGLNNCNPTPSITAVPNIDLTDGCTADHFVYTGGDQGTAVVLYRVNGGAHTWPGAPITIGVTNQDFSASVEIWRFLRRYKLSQLITAIVESAAEPDVLIYPNPGDGIVNLRFSNAGMRRLEIFDPAGRSVAVSTVYGTITTLELPQPGVYFVQVVSEGYVYTKKLIRE